MMNFKVRPLITPFNIDDRKLDGKMRTVSGITFDILNPKASQVLILDIAHGLAYKAHFAGQSKEYFSIAQHSILVCEFIPEKKRHDIEFFLLALLHDAAEAYIGDMIKPLKVYLPEYSKIEKNIMQAICRHYGLPFERLNEVKEYDLAAQQCEYNNFYCGAKDIEYLSPQESLDEFLLLFNALMLMKCYKI